MRKRFVVVTEERTWSFVHKVEPDNTENQQILPLLTTLECWADIWTEK